MDCFPLWKAVKMFRSKTEGSNLLQYWLTCADLSYVRKLLSLMGMCIHFFSFKGKFKFRRDSWEARRCNRISSTTQCTAQQETIGTNISASQNLNAWEDCCWSSGEKTRQYNIQTDLSRWLFSLLSHFEIELKLQRWALHPVVTGLQCTRWLFSQQFWENVQELKGFLILKKLQLDLWFNFFQLLLLFCTGVGFWALSYWSTF